ncbi:hypothetical protein B6N60_00308 [Richelia sinica FACHB-800]|uniref:Uncharacterized protein n=1 Tax=Richelia sinica FACHB-800 TaxID=1357546 RepID=A0A975Y301_9NOST|nr:hypothetical protein B6N60_00308 [Richelia sinica FACHB-800]
MIAINPNLSKNPDADTHKKSKRTLSKQQKCAAKLVC